MTICSRTLRAEAFHDDRLHLVFLMRALGVLIAVLVAAPASAQEPPPPPAERPRPEPAPPAERPRPGIAGVVHGADGKTPIANAIVTLTNTTFAAITDDRGAYALEDVPPGSYELRVSLAGYEDAVQPIVVTAQPLALTSTLQKTVTGEEIVVTGSKFPEKRVEAPVTLERVTSQDVEQTGASSYMTALSQVKGIQYRQSGVGDVRLSMRGFDSQFNTRMLFMEDGRLTEFPGNGVPLGASLPTPSLDIKSVEVIVGPASALYGANAVDGVVNVITKTPWDESGASASIRVGNQNLGDVSLRVAGTVGHRFGYKGNFQWMQAQDFLPDRNLPYHYFGANMKAPMGIFEGDLVANGYKLRQAKVEGFLYGRLGHDWNLKAGGGYSIVDGISATNTGRNELRGFSVDYETVQLSHPNWFAQVTRTGSNAGDSYQVDALASVVNGAGGLAAFNGASLEAVRQKIKFIDSSQMIDSELQYRTELWRMLRLTAGGQFRAYFPSSNGTYLDDGNGKSIRRYVGGEYLQAELDAFHKRLRIVGAVRVDEFSDYGVQASPKGAVVVSLAKDHFLRVGYNRAFRTPTILDAYLDIPTYAAFGNHTGFTIKDMSGNIVAKIPALAPEENNTVELGYKGSIAHRLFIDLVGFYSFYNNFISPLSLVAFPTKGTTASLPDGTPTFAGTPMQGALLTYTNFGSAQVAGANGGLDWWIWRDKLLFTGSASYIHLVTFSAGSAMQKDLPLNVPEWNGRFSLQLQDAGFRGLFVRFQGRVQEHFKFQSGFWDSTKPGWFANGELPTRFVADLVAGVRFPNGVTVSGTIYDLFNDHGIDVLGAPPSGIVGFVQLQYAYAGLDY